MTVTTLTEQAWLDQGESFLRPNFDDRVQEMDCAIRICRDQYNYDHSDVLAALQFIVDNGLTGKLDTGINESINYYTQTGELWP
jgi:hypothetical protein